MPRDRFKEIMKFLRFDHRSERSSRLQQDKFALISDVWKKFIENCLSCYKPGENVTVDEQLFSTKVRCRFLQYIANKPDKFGIKFWLCVDVDSKFVLNGFPYLGKDESRPQNQSLSESVVMRLVEPFANTGRNVTTDNFFTSLSLANNLLAKRTTIVGTLNRARREVPPYVKSLHMTLFETKILKSDRCTLTIYQGKRNKNVLLLSTLHENVEIDSNHPKKKPETVTFYNATKYGVDVADQMAKI
ncbi:PiggyBac transposable element-derived protein 4 [Eumeta japonica]|uniref:PiggyBac transposable element-derived protein 4 n=1 Tax=Eumeta variegata TaxID=151549 RepID=A0A4C2AE52_EUMVA|nr:PiggyBac transposable element-derived protein 4 [Eumeta japonica]